MISSFNFEKGQTSVPAAEPSTPINPEMTALPPVEPLESGNGPYEVCQEGPVTYYRYYFGEIQPATAPVERSDRSDLMRLGLIGGGALAASVVSGVMLMDVFKPAPDAPKDQPASQTTVKPNATSQQTKPKPTTPERLEAGPVARPATPKPPAKATKPSSQVVPLQAPRSPVPSIATVRSQIAALPVSPGSFSQPAVRPQASQTQAKIQAAANRAARSAAAPRSGLSAPAPTPAPPAPTFSSPVTAPAGIAPPERTPITASPGFSNTPSSPAGPESMVDDRWVTPAPVVAPPVSQVAPAPVADPTAFTPSTALPPQAAEPRPALPVNGDAAPLDASAPAPPPPIAMNSLVPPASLPSAATQPDVPPSSLSASSLAATGRKELLTSASPKPMLNTTQGRPQSLQEFVQWSAPTAAADQASILPLTRQAATSAQRINRMSGFTFFQLKPQEYQQFWQASQSNQATPVRSANLPPAASLSASAPEHGFIDYERQIVVIPQGVQSASANPQEPSSTSRVMVPPVRTASPGPS